MRDALSLLSQTIAYSKGNVRSEAVLHLLGISPITRLFTLLDALSSNDAATLMDAINTLHTHAPDYDQALSDLLLILHQAALCQLLPTATLDNPWEETKKSKP